MRYKDSRSAVRQNILFRFYGLLFWSGLIVIILLFGWGIYIGDRYRVSILKYERELLGMKQSSHPIKLNAKGEIITIAAVDSNNPESTPSNAKSSGLSHLSSSRAGKEKASVPSSSKQMNRQLGKQPFQDSEPGKATDLNKLTTTVETPLEGQSHSSPTAMEYPTNSTSNSIQGNTDVAQPTHQLQKESSDFPADLQDQKSIPIVKRIKVLVDDEYASIHSDWITLTARAISIASQIYSTEFGIELKLVGVMRWYDTLSYMSDEQLLESLKKHEREGADMVLGFVNRDLESSTYALGVPRDGSPYNGAYSVLGISDPQEQTFYRGVLRSIGHLFGAREVIDKQSEAYRLGSWMSDAPQSVDRSVWIDWENRKRILQHKSLPTCTECPTGL